MGTLRESLSVFVSTKYTIFEPEFWIVISIKIKKYMTMHITSSSYILGWLHNFCFKSIENKSNYIVRFVNTSNVYSSWKTTIPHMSTFYSQIHNFGI